MASRISQMRNAAPQQQQLNPQIIEQTQRLMASVKNAQNPEAMLAQIIQSNPNSAAIANMLKQNGSLESIARQMAQANNIDIMELIQSLTIN